MKKFLKDFKNEFLNEINAPQNNEHLKEIIGIKKEEPKSKFKGFFTPMKLALGVLILIIVVGVTFIFVGNTNKSVPKYLGMNATSMESLLSNKLINKVKYLDSTEDIEDEINEEIKPIINGDISYYAKKSEIVLITITLENPKQYEILSFTLNGKKYQSFEFLEGSNSNTIIVKYECKDSAGIEDITIDAIKYVRGERIRDCRYIGNRTIKIGITYEDLPIVNDLNINCDINKVNINFNIIKSKEDLSVNSYQLFIFDSINIVKIINIKEGNNNIKVDNLSMGTTYEMAIVGVYDMFNGKGLCANILSKAFFTTLDGVSISNIIITHNEISFDLLKEDNVEIKEVYLEKDGNIINPTTNNYSFNNLLANSNYKLTIKYLNNGKISTFTKELKTNVVVTPTLTINSGIAFGNNITIYFTKSDSLNLIKDLDFSLYDSNNNLVAKEVTFTFEESLNQFVVTFTNITIPGDYKVVASYHYDLLDGNGNHEINKDSIEKGNMLVVPKQ